MKQQLPPRAILPVMPLALVVSAHEGALNVATHGQVCTLSSNPPTMGISVQREHKTAELIRRSGAFSLNIPPVELLERVLFCGSRSGSDTEKAALFTMAESAFGTPTLKECPVSLICALRQTIEVGDSLFFVGEVTEVIADPSCLTDETPDAQKCRTLLCSLDGRFFSIGEPLPAVRS